MTTAYDAHNRLASATVSSTTTSFLIAPLTGLPSVEALKELAQLVDGILEAFANMVRARGRPSPAMEGHVDTCVFPRPSASASFLTPSRVVNK